MTRVRVPLHAYTGCSNTGSGSGACSSSNGGSSATTFLELTDTPDSYAGAAGLGVKVKLTEDGLEFGGVIAAGLDAAVVSTAGGTITLDMNSQAERMFRGSASIGAAKTWALSNDTNAIFIPSVKFTMTTLNIQTFPANFKMATYDANWNSSTQQWTPPDVGTYDLQAIFDGTNWLMTITGPY